MEPIVVARHEDHNITLPSGETFHVVLFGGSDAEYRERGETPPPVVFCVHGAGMSSASFFLLATHLAEADGANGVVRVAAYDMRCHGDSTFGGGEAGLTRGVLVDDFRALLAAARATLFADTPRLYVAGHSLGGSVVVHALRDGGVDGIAGVVLLDIAEGTAAGSLRHMDAFLRDRPTRFNDVNAAAQWFLQRGGMRSPAAAAITVPPLLKLVEDGHLEWKSDLAAMSSVWSDWFEGLDDAFVSLPCPKLLCLANTERLDVALTVAQMQGKFQLEVLGNGCGHYVMDDQPAALAAKLRRFIKRIETMSEILRLNTKKPLSTNQAKTPSDEATAAKEVSKP
ncbi:protein phosphatase methylesterase 1 [Trypanosoma theileri]|uniref:Protein phosphatase methylesterase 1 n=1 Tax=Trypanosoma theileri TaxID=67003 RepID=A0A1X0NUM3_9TRYP|nr:protein phosphatase methylesterase 1 [Trypanosoma theileri]ORC88404.1 protein phosphatase methylesterase 1 [Trypanosoma theileri]